MPLSFSYTIRRNIRARRMIITVYPDKGVVVTVPRKVSRFFIDRAVRKKSSWILKTIAKLHTHTTLRFPAVGDKKSFRHYREFARVLAHDRIRELNAGYNFSFNRISIRNQKSRWGSCSKQGNLNFNYRIVLLPAHLVDYIMVHELCHLQELNHSPRFWDLVSRTIPHHRACRRELRGMKVN